MPEMMQASQAMELATRFFHGQDRLKGPLQGTRKFGSAWYAAFPDIVPRRG